MKINEVLIETPIPNLQTFLNTFPKMPPHVAKDIWRQKQPATDPRVINQLKKGASAEETFISLMTGRLSGITKDPMTGLSPEDLEKVLLQASWNLQKLKVNPSNFTPHTIERMKIWEGDPARIERAKASNDPVTLIKSEQGLILWEGWHRTMLKLKSGSDGTNNYANWEPVELNAWVASY